MNRHRKLRYLILAGDLMWLGVIVLMPSWLRTGLLAHAGGSRPWTAALVAVVAWAALYLTKDLEGFRGGWRFPHICAQVIVGVLYLVVFLSGIAVVTRTLYVPSTLFDLGLLSPPGFIGIRCLAWAAVILRGRRHPKRRVVIVGTGRLVRELTLKISHHPEMGMEVAGVLFPSEKEQARRGLNLPPGAMSIRTLDILGLIKERNVQELIVVEPLPPVVESAKLIASCRSAGVAVHLVPQRYELYRSKAKLTEIEGVPLLTLEEHFQPVLGGKVKRAMDVVGALLLLILASPLLVVSAMVLYLHKRKAIRKEQRCGKNGRVFWMYRLNVDREDPNLRAGERFLAQFSLTELPQLWNVLRNEMSLVGPRPESPDRVKHYSEWQRQRLSMSPGLTGLAQVNGLREQHSSEAKARFDLQYILHWSLFLDLSLLFQTGSTFFVRLIEPWLRSSPRLQPDVETELSIAMVANANSAQSGAD
jgi:lipopolysaccharide/colanic/teichoic acid biosynthesis glycosyltransferase